MDGQLTYKLELFEGPLDLLLNLIAKNKMKIEDIKISIICDQYMEYIASAEKMPKSVIININLILTFSGAMIFIKLLRIRFMINNMRKDMFILQTDIIFSEVYIILQNYNGCDLIDGSFSLFTSCIC